MPPRRGLGRGLDALIAPPPAGAADAAAGAGENMPAADEPGAAAPLLVEVGRSVPELALVENVQREDLNPLEEAAAYQQLAEEFGLTQEQIGQRVGKSRFAINNTMRLLQLPAAVQQAVLDGLLSEGHARAIL